MLRSSNLLSDHFLFGFLAEELTEGVDEELEEVFGCTKDNLNKNDELKVIEILFTLCHFSHFYDSVTW